MPQRNLLTIFLALVIGLACYEQAARGRYAHLVSQVIDTVENHYVDTVDRRTLAEAAIRGITRQLDPYSDFIPPRQYEQFQDVLDQQFGGIGILVGVDPETQQLMVISPLPGTPAFEAGLLAGDLIESIDGEPTRGMTAEEAVEFMRGAPGEPVTLSVRTPDQPSAREVRIERAIIQVDSVLGDRRRPDGQWDFLLEADRRIALIRVTNFGDRTATELRRALRSVRGEAQGIVIDLRDNAGGLLSAAVEVVDMFLSEGPIVSIRGRDPEQQRVIEASARSTIIPPHSLPIVVLVNQYSASASEIVAAAMQDHDLATVIGQRTYGKGTVQNLFPLEAGKSALKLTVATYWRPSGQDIHRRQDAGEEENWGVRPDPGWEVRMEDEQMRELWEYRQDRDLLQPGEAGDGRLLEVDPQLKKAVEFLQQQFDQAGQDRAAFHQQLDHLDHHGQKLASKNRGPQRTDDRRLFPGRRADVLAHRRNEDRF